MLETTYCLVENDVLFFGENGRVAKYKGETEKQNEVKRQSVLGCVTLVIAKSEKSL